MRLAPSAIDIDTSPLRLRCQPVRWLLCFRALVCVCVAQCVFVCPRARSRFASIDASLGSASHSLANDDIPPKLSRLPVRLLHGFTRFTRQIAGAAGPGRSPPIALCVAARACGGRARLAACVRACEGASARGPPRPPPLLSEDETILTIWNYRLSPMIRH